MAKFTSNQGRTMQMPVLCYISARVNYNTPGIASDQSFRVGELPEGAVINTATVFVRTVFNAATTNVLTVGTDTNTNNLFDAATGGSSVNEAAVGANDSAIARGYVVGAGGEVVFARYTQSGTAATTGQADIYITYWPRLG